MQLGSKQDFLNNQMSNDAVGPASFWEDPIAVSRTEKGKQKVGCDGNKVGMSLRALENELCNVAVLSQTKSISDTSNSRALEREVRPLFSLKAVEEVQKEHQGDSDVSIARRRNDILGLDGLVEVEVHEADRGG